MVYLFVIAISFSIPYHGFRTVYDVNGSYLNLLPAKVIHMTHPLENNHCAVHTKMLQVDIVPIIVSL